jgi:hypothetical protein
MIFSVIIAIASLAATLLVLTDSRQTALAKISIAQAASFPASAH